MFQCLPLRSKNAGRFTLIAILFCSLLLTGYRHQFSSFTNSADSLKIADFVEKEFPFISTHIDGRSIGNGFPSNNLAARTVAIQLGDSAFMTFDTDLLRWSVAWTRKFMPMTLMAQVSYSDFHNKNNQIATIAGIPMLATGHYAGWKSGNKTAQMVNGNVVPEEWSALPETQGRWNGIYTLGTKVVMNYSVGEAQVLEHPGQVSFSNQTAFTRTLSIKNNKQDLWLTAAHVTNTKKVVQKGNVILLYQGTAQDTVTAIGYLGRKSKSLTLGVQGDSLLTVRFLASDEPATASLALWKGPASLVGQFEKLCKKTKIDFPDPLQGGPAYWPQIISTQGSLSPDTAAYVTDKLSLPLPNPWNRGVRAADIAFFKDGRAALITFEGDVWIIGGIDRGLQNLQWKRFASGMNETMSIEVVDEKVLVFSRNGITRLHDLNGNGEADYYENFSNIIPQSAEGREWAGDLVHAMDGSYYVAIGGSLSNGPGITPKVANGFRQGSRYNGSILKLSADGRSFEVVATGLRGPYLGYHPEKDILTASDQQGNFVPSTPLFVVKKGDYFGVPPTMHRDDNPPITPPLTWIPHNIDQSAIGQAWLTGNKMGPMSGDMVHLSFGRPGLFRVLIDSSAQVIQGAVTPINADYPTPTSKAAVSPKDEQLYIAGFNLWGSKSKGISALLRLRYTGMPSYMPSKFQAGQQGVIIGFDSPLDPESIHQKGSFKVKRYNYQLTDAYGSGHFKLDGSKGEEILPVRASYLSADRKQVLLLIPDMRTVMQMELEYDLKAKDGKRMQDGAYFSINHAGSMDLKPYGFSNVDLALLEKAPDKAEQEEEEPATVARGEKVFRTMACAGCHSEGTRTKGMYGPPFQNLYGATRQFEDGTSGIADEAYLRESLLAPAKKIVKGYSPEMPSFEGILTETDIASVSMYIKSLGKK
ncbi:DUF6797 domain-containing protein [Dyadobacter tibetensis]|uniref:DUF6797 domain-containing protein n=1 Tax=Dyadobacter tibetensis TaxID=1211851 RepID=UPI000472E7E3|nr:DUF6797 domain-containing protein [Dyadobacter tibetensis]